MKVDNSVKSSASASTAASSGAGAARQRTGVAPGVASAPEAETSSTQVNISSLSSLGVDSILANAPVTNPEKIAEIKQAMADGKFTVSADKIASGLINSVRQMLANPSTGA